MNPRQVRIPCTEVTIAPDFYRYFRDVLHSNFDNDIDFLRRVLESGDEGALHVVFMDFHAANENSRLVLQSLISLLEKVQKRSDLVTFELG